MDKPGDGLCVIERKSTAEATAIVQHTSHLRQIARNKRKAWKPLDEPLACKLQQTRVCRGPMSFM